ncbi:hypothetical protein SUDANB178_07496 [Streptomyces sp. enrichment culture]
MGERRRSGAARGGRVTAGPGRSAGPRSCRRRRPMRSRNHRVSRATTVDSTVIRGEEGLRDPGVRRLYRLPAGRARADGGHGRVGACPAGGRHRAGRRRCRRRGPRDARRVTPPPARRPPPPLLRSGGQPHRPGLDEQIVRTAVDDYTGRPTDGDRRPARPLPRRIEDQAVLRPLTATGPPRCTSGPASPPTQRGPTGLPCPAASRRRACCLEAAPAAVPYRPEGRPRPGAGDRRRHGGADPADAWSRRRARQAPGPRGR